MSYLQGAEASIEHSEDTGKAFDHELVRTLALMSIAESLATLAAQGASPVVDWDECLPIEENVKARTPRPLAPRPGTT